MALDYTRIHRLLKIISLIQGGGQWTPQRLAVDCSVNVRSIFRDIRVLEDAGVPCFYDRVRKTYAIRRDFFMPPVDLTLDESLAITALVEQISGRQQVPHLRAASRAISKIRGQLPPAIQRELDAIESRVEIHLAPTSPDDSADVYERMRDLMLQRRAATCVYESVSGDASSHAKPFLFKPYALFFSTHAWYVVGHHARHDAIRCLKLSRFTQVTPTTQTFNVPRGFSLERNLGNAWRMIRGKKSYNVVLNFDADFADTVADTFWHKTQQVDWNDDGSIRFSCKVDGLDEIVWWVMGMGPHCRVEAPVELAQRVRDLARQTARMYDD